MTIAIVVYGGAKAVSKEKEQPNKEGCLAAVQAGWDILSQGGEAKAAVEAAIRVLESDQTFNAGFGSCLLLDRNGRIGWAYNSKDMAVAYMHEALPQPEVFTRKEKTASLNT